MALPKLPFRRHWLVLLMLAITIYIVLPQLGSFKDSLNHMVEADPLLAGLAIFSFSFTYLAAAATYCLLALRPLKYWQTVLIQLAGMFVNRLLPAGIGALGVSYAYLHGRKHSAAQAGVVVALNNALGFAGHMTLVIAGSLLFRQQIPPLEFTIAKGIWLWLGVALLVIAATILLSSTRMRGRAEGLLKTVRQQLLTYRKRPHRPLLALVTSMCLTLAHVITLAICLEAVNASLPFIAVLLVLGVGVAAGSAAPTPGGLGGMEAGLVAGLVAFGLAASVALAAVLLYRLITYWLALAVGAGAFIYVQKRGLLEFKL